MCSVLLIDFTAGGDEGAADAYGRHVFGYVRRRQFQGLVFGRLGNNSSGDGWMGTN